MGLRLVPPLALELGRRQIVGGAVEPTSIPPVHPLGSVVDQALQLLVPYYGPSRAGGGCGDGP